MYKNAGCGTDEEEGIFRSGNIGEVIAENSFDKAGNIVDLWYLLFWWKMAVR